MDLPQVFRETKEETASVLRCCRCCACLGQRQPWQPGRLAPASKNGSGGAVPVRPSAGIRWSHASRRGGDVPPGAAATQLHAYTRRVRTTLLGRVRDASSEARGQGRLSQRCERGTRKADSIECEAASSWRKLGEAARIRNCFNYSKIKKIAGYVRDMYPNISVSIGRQEAISR